MKNLYIFPYESELHNAPLIDLMALSIQEQAPVTFDIRYASENNFTGKKIYDSPRAFLMAEAALSLIKTAQNLKQKGYGLRIFDAYRPWHVTAYFWTYYPESHLYLADPNQGSRHNRGCAVDLTLYDLATNRDVQMPSHYDEFNEKAHLNYAGGTDAERQARSILQSTMLDAGFTAHTHEWWHFDYIGWEKYRVRDDDFETLDQLLNN